MTGRVIFVDDEKHLRLACSQSLELAGFAVDSFASAAGALDQVTVQWPGVIVSDVRMAGTDGIELMVREWRDNSLSVDILDGADRLVSLTALDEDGQVVGGGVLVLLLVGLEHGGRDGSRVHDDGVGVTSHVALELLDHDRPRHPDRGPVYTG